jgi:Methylase of polypeptide chain release factors
LAIYREIAQSISKYIDAKGYIFLEIGYRQGEKVSAIFQQALPEAKIEIWKDFNDLDRLVAIFCA